MLKILNVAQLREADADAIRNEPVASIDLMERACYSFVTWFVARYPIGIKAAIICGTGNNGGDGLGIARLLKRWGYELSVFIVKGGSESEDFKTNLARLIEAGISPADINSSNNIPDFSNYKILVDAIFGSGLSRSPDGITKQLIEKLNKPSATRISVDVPSGLYADKPVDGIAFRADHTFTFQSPKLSFLFPENAKYVGEWEVGDIGLRKKFIEGLPTQNYLVTEKDARELLKPRPKFANKGLFGKALLIAGSTGKMGACVLAARAALRSGVGLLTLHVPSTGDTIVQTAIPEAMSVVDSHPHIFTEATGLESYSAIGIGPGIGKDDASRKGFETVLQAMKPMVIDADALNMMSEHRNLLKQIPAGSILTPHPKEFERLTKKWSNDFERLDLQRNLSKDTGAVVVLKGAYTSTALPDGTVYFNSTGNPGMAKGGSGDVLTGVLTGLLAQGYQASDAAVLGVYLHGLAGDIGAEQKGVYSLLASDLIEALPEAYKKILPLTQ